MCGLAGFLSTSRRISADTMIAMVKGMANAMQHRGPDDAGSWCDEERGVALGHRRLSVIDLSPLGHQPMISQSGHHVIVYNGEIYNFRALRTELEAKGHMFRSRSDTEVMLEAFSEWGVDGAVRKLNGMFAFAVWDRRAQTMTLGRDRFGEKPLYYGWFDGTFVFASELKGLCQHASVTLEIDRDALGLYVRHGYVPAPHSIYRHIQKLLPGTLLTIGLRSPSHVSEPVPYWSAVEAMLAANSSPFVGSEAEAINGLRSRLEEAVIARMESDVPLGAFLSGGVDSSAIVAIMQRSTNRPIKTFTVGFDEAAYDEASHAREVAHHLGTDHTELRVSPSESMGVVPLLPSLYDEPFADSSQIPTYLIAKLARTHVTVSLSGDGGDELLAGYNRYLLATSISKRVLGTPTPIRRLLGRVLHAISPESWDNALGAVSMVLPRRRLPRHLGNKLHRIGGVLLGTDGQGAYSSFMTVWEHPSEVVLGASDTANQTASLPSSAGELDDASQMMLLDAISYLPDDILVKVDRASMAVSLESRAPFLDHTLAEFCWSLPISMKLRGGNLKWLLRRVLDSYVPKTLVDRPKSGFTVPIGLWLRGPMKEWAADLLARDRLQAQGFFDADRVSDVWNAHLGGSANWQDRLWCVLMFESWLGQQAHERARVN